MWPFHGTPSDAQIITFTEAPFTFQGPTGARFVRFKQNGGPAALRLVYADKGGERIRIDIERWTADLSAEAAAEAAYKLAHPFAAEDNIAPMRLSLEEDVQLWRFRRRFLDGLSAPLIIDTAFYQQGAEIYRLEYAAAPDGFYKRLWVFDTVVQTFRVASHSSAS